MEKNLYPIVPVSLVLFGMIVACNFVTAPFQGLKTETPAPTPIASLTETPTLVPTATNTVTPIHATKTPFPTTTRMLTPAATSTPQLASFCESDAARPSQCHFPIAEQSSTFCVKKSPYNLIVLNESATYEVLHEHIQCSEAGIVDGQRMITCTGPMAYYFELKVCDSACSTLTIELDSTRCPKNYRYNNLQNCCTEETQEVNQGCVTLKLKTDSCVVDCGQFSTKTSCTDYGYACRWDDTNDVCYLRR